MQWTVSVISLSARRLKSSCISSIQDTYFGGLKPAQMEPDRAAFTPELSPVARGRPSLQNSLQWPAGQLTGRLSRQRSLQRLASTPGFREDIVALPLRMMPSLYQLNTMRAVYPCPCLRPCPVPQPYPPLNPDPCPYLYLSLCSCLCPS